MNREIKPLPQFDFVSPDIPEADAIAAYTRDGEVSLRNALSSQIHVTI